MKKIFLFLASIFTMAIVNAQAIYEPDAEGNNNKITIELDEVDDISESSFTIYLSNPSISLCGLSAYFYFDDNSVKPWCYDDAAGYILEGNNYSKKSNPNGRLNGHSITSFLCDASNKEHAYQFFVGIAGATDFLGTEGWMATVYFDATKLSDGTHYLHMVNPECAWTNADASATATYKCANQDLLFKIHNGTMTFIETIPVQTENHAIYDLQGRRFNQVQQGVNIINGKKILH